ncbi:hypothetical protein NYV37_10960 [Escherichia coli]|nr:hypothetical protein [Escherichia coli]
MRFGVDAYFKTQHGFSPHHGVNTSDQRRFDCCVTLNGSSVRRVLQRQRLTMGNWSIEWLKLNRIPASLTGVSGRPASAPGNNLEALLSFPLLLLLVFYFTADRHSSLLH